MFEPLNIQQVGSSLSYVNDENAPQVHSSKMRTSQICKNRPSRNQRSVSQQNSSTSTNTCTVLGNHNPKVPNQHNMHFLSGNQKKIAMPLTPVSGKKTRVFVHGNAIFENIKNNNNNNNNNNKVSEDLKECRNKPLETIKTEGNSKLENSNLVHNNEGRKDENTLGNLNLIIKGSVACSQASIKHSQTSSQTNRSLEKSQPTEEKINVELDNISDITSQLSNPKNSKGLGKGEKKHVDLATLIRDLNDICGRDLLSLSASMIMKIGGQEQSEGNSNLSQRNENEIMHTNSSFSSFSKDSSKLQDNEQNGITIQVQANNHLNNTKSLRKAKSYHSKPTEGEKENEDEYEYEEELNSRVSQQQQQQQQNENLEYTHSTTQGGIRSIASSSCQQWRTYTPAQKGAIESLKHRLAITAENESVMALTEPSKQTHKKANEHFPLNTPTQIDNLHLNFQTSTIYDDKQSIFQQSKFDTESQFFTPSKSQMRNNNFNNSHLYKSDNKQHAVIHHPPQSLSAQHNSKQQQTQPQPYPQQQQWLHKQQYQTESKRNMLRKMCNFTQVARGKYSFHKLNKQKKELNNISNVLYNCLLENYEVDNNNISLQSKSLSANWCSNKGQPNSNVSKDLSNSNNRRGSPKRQRAYDEEENDSPDFNHMRKYYNQKYGLKLRQIENEQQLQQSQNLQQHLPHQSKPPVVFRTAGLYTPKKIPVRNNNNKITDANSFSQQTGKFPQTALRNTHMNNHRLLFSAPENMPIEIAINQASEEGVNNNHESLDDLHKMNPAVISAFETAVLEPEVVQTVQNGHQSLSNGMFVTPSRSAKRRSSGFTGLKKGINLDMEIQPWGNDESN